MRGPARVSIRSGWASILGYRVDGGSFVVPAGRSAVIEYDGVVEVSGGSLGEARGVEALAEAARDLAGRSRVLMVGPPDSGKSTLSAYILNYSGSHEYLTLDVGQNEIFSPGFASLASPVRPVIPGSDESFSRVEPCFVGDFTPRGSEASYLSCAARLSRGSHSLVVDTDGWVDLWEGVELKAGLAHVVGASVIAAVGLGDREARALEDLSGVEVVRLPRLSGGEKGLGERRLHRERLLAFRLRGSRVRPVKAGEAEIVGLPVFRGREARPPAGSRAVYSEEYRGGMVVVSPRRPQGFGGLWLRPGWERGLLAAVHGDGVGVGVVLRVNYRSRIVEVATPHEGPVRMVEVGRARVSESVLGMVTGRP